MKADGNRHLTPDEIVERVFPAEDGPEAVPSHLAACAECQAKVARLREAWLLDRGAVDGVVDALPEAYWDGQRAAILRTIEGASTPERPVTSGILPFPAPVRTNRLFRRPLLAVSSLAAALALVAVVSVLRFGAPEATEKGSNAMATPAVSTAPAGDQADDELLLSIDRILLEEPAYTSLIPDETT
jgi:anti-sigma factor RsiW